MNLPTSLGAERLRLSCKWVGFSPEIVDAFSVARSNAAANSGLSQSLRENAALYAEEKILPDDLHPEFPMFYPLLFMANLDRLRSAHERRKIPEAITQRTVRDLELWLHARHKRDGIWGTDKVAWHAVCFRGNLVQLGRLQFEATTFAEGYSIADQQAIALSTGDPVLSIHVPESGKLDPLACGESISEARRFFPRHFPEHPFKAFFCASWLMNGHLKDYLPEEANLVRFMSMFKPVQCKSATDDQVWERVFGGPISDFVAVPRDTALRRAVLKHAEMGNRWLTSAGYIPRGEAL